MKHLRILILLSAIVMALNAFAQHNDKLPENIDYDVIIVGGGLSGLTAAYDLKGMNILVLEKEDIAGGRIKSGVWNNIHYAKGMEYIGPPDKDVSDFFSKLGLSPIQVPAPTDGIAMNALIYYEAEILDFLDSSKLKSQYEQLQEALEGLDEETNDAIWEDYTELKDYANYDNQSVDEWMTDKNYAEIIKKFIDTENRGLFGASNQDLSFLFNINEMAYNLSDESDYQTSEVYTFPLGMTQLVNTLINILGTRVSLGAEVTNVAVNDDNSVAVSYTQGGVAKSATAKSVIVTTPAPITKYLVSNGLSPEVKTALDSVKYSEYITVALYMSDRIFDEAWSIACVDDYFVTLYDAVRTQVASGYEGESVMNVYIAPDTADQSIIYRSDTEILEGIKTDLEQYFPGASTKIVGADIQRWKYAFPVFHKGYRNVIKTLQEDETVGGPVFLAGDYMVYATFDGAFWSGKYAAENVIEYLEE